MRVMSKLSPLAVAVSLGVSALAAPVAVNAETSASIAASNFYLWRGQDISNGQAAVSGQLDYSHSSGAYTGIWASSEDGGSEYDVWVGYATEVGGLGIDVSIWEYHYPSDTDDDGLHHSQKFGDVAELIIGLSLGDASFTLYEDIASTGYMYYTLGYSFDKYSLTLGSWSVDGDKPENDDRAEYMHLDFGVALTDELSMTLSKVISPAEADGNKGGFDSVPAGAVPAGDKQDSDMLVHFSWSKSFDL